MTSLAVIISMLTFIFGSGFFVNIAKKIKEEQEKNDKKLIALSYGVQALLRDKLLEIYTKCNDEGYADINIRNNFENIWNNYHTLCPNGVMDDVHEKFLNLPIK